MEVVNKKLVLVVIMIGTFFAFFIWQNISDNKTKLEMVSLNNEIKSSSMFAIMLEQEDGTYKESKDNIWPTDDTYVYDITKSGCMDANGNKIENSLEYDLVNNIARVKTEKSSYCYLYFSKPINLYELCEGTENMSSCLSQKEDQIYMVNNVTDEITGGMYRYQGTKDKVIDNYICFGTSDTTECLNKTDKYLYRILGFDSNGYIKVIKKEALNSVSQWYNNTTSDISWPDSKLFSQLNGDSFLLNEQYISDEYTNSIMDINWKHGATASNANYDGTIMYTIEDGWQDTINAKIGLLYLHDYYYAYEGGVPGNYANARIAWIFLENNDDAPPNPHEWTMTFYGFGNDNKYNAWIIRSDGWTSYWVLNNSGSLRPVFYLDNTIKISSGEGTIETPFIIE